MFELEAHARTLYKPVAKQRAAIHVGLPLQSKIKS